jgi:hypothetical protein
MEAVEAEQMPDGKGTRHWPDGRTYKGVNNDPLAMFVKGCSLPHQSILPCLPVYRAILVGKTPWPGGNALA